MKNTQGSEMIDEKKTKTRIIHIIIAVILWFITSWIAVQEIFLARSMFISIYFRILQILSLPATIRERLTAPVIGNLAAFVMAVVAIVIVIGGFDYHWNHVGEKKSYKVFAWTLAFQLVFLALTAVF
jgi:hypothetical protein